MTIFEERGILEHGTPGSKCDQCSLIDTRLLSTETLSFLLSELNEFSNDLEKLYTSKRRSLGQGRFAIVYKYMLKNPDNQLPRKIAVKVFPAKYMKEFKAECKQFKNIYHKKPLNIVKCYGSCKILPEEDDDYATNRIEYGIALRLYDGDLYEHVNGDNWQKMEKIHQVQEVPSILIQMAEGMRSLRKLFIIHRDINPGNILVKNTNIGLQVKDKAEYFFFYCFAKELNIHSPLFHRLL